MGSHGVEQVRHIDGHGSYHYIDRSRMTCGVDPKGTIGRRAFARIRPSIGGNAPKEVAANASGEP